MSCKDDTKQHLLEAVRLIVLGKIERDAHHLDMARQHYEEAASIYRAEGDPLRLAHTIRHVADILREDSRPNLAEPVYREALELYRADPGTPPLDLANAIRGLAVLQSEAGQTQEARALWEEARRLYASVGVQAGVLEASRRLAQV